MESKENVTEEIEPVIGEHHSSENWVLVVSFT
jgi:hypothetical protein